VPVRVNTSEFKIEVKRERERERKRESFAVKSSQLAVETCSKALTGTFSLRNFATKKT